MNLLAFSGSAPAPLSRAMALACLITGSDRDLVQHVNDLDRNIIASNAITLGLVYWLALSAWTLTLLSVSTPGYALHWALLIASIVLMLDRAASRNDYELAGILRDGGPSAKLWGRALVRIVIAGSLAYGTSLGVTLAINAGAIDAQLRRDVARENATLRSEYQSRIDDLRDRRIAPLEGELATLRQQRDEQLARIATADATLSEARRRAADSRIEAEREARGGLDGYVRGPGPRFADARRIERESDLRASTAAAESVAAAGRRDTLAAQIQQRMQDLQRATRDFERASAQLETGLYADPRWQPVPTGLLARYSGLENLKRDPLVGPAVRHFEQVCLIVLFALELSFLLIKVAFREASVYSVALIARTRLEAARIAQQTEAALAAMRRQYHPNGPNLRVVDADPAPSAGTPGSAA